MGHSASSAWNAWSIHLACELVEQRIWNKPQAGESAETASLASEYRNPHAAQNKLVDNTPIENRGPAFVQTSEPSPQVPEPGRMLLPQKNECKTFLIFLKRISVCLILVLFCTFGLELFGLT
jgi:hypothetical protein